MKMVSLNRNVKCLKMGHYSTEKEKIGRFFVWVVSQFII